MISFIIPTKNEERALAETLACLAAYTGEKEIIVSDGRSTDRTIEIARRYTDTIVVFAGAGRQTIANGRNAGAAVARGEFLVFLDADVRIFEPDAFFAELGRRFAGDPGLVAATVRIRVLPQYATLIDRIVFFLLNATHLIGNNWIPVGAAPGEFEMIRADAFRRVGGFDEKLAAAEDEDLFHRLARIGRTRFAWDLSVYHTGRRAHAIGWPKLLWQWNTNYLSMLLFKRAASDEWKEIR